MCKQKGHYAEYCPQKAISKTQKVGGSQTGGPGGSNQISREDRIYNEIEALTNNKDEMRENTPNEGQHPGDSNGALSINVD
jgi:hypothetical protein